MRLADFILAHLEPILADWEVFARGIWPDGTGATDQVALRDDAEGMLRAAVTDMKSDQTSAEQSDKSKGQGDDSAHQSRVDRVSSRHGSGRYGSGFNLPAVIAEYRALRGSVVRLWGESHPAPELTDLTDLIRFNESIDQSLTQAVLAFSKLVARERQAALDDQSRQAQRMREVNEALLVSSVRQHELTEKAEKAEAALVASEARFRALFDQGPIAAYSCDAVGRIQEYNASAVALWGREPEKGNPDERFCGSYKLYLPDGSSMPHDRSPVADVLGGKLPAVHDAEVVIERPDGSRVTVIANIVPLKNDRGEITGAMSCFYDITERTRSEDALRASQSRLRHAANSEFSIDVVPTSTGWPRVWQSRMSWVTASYFSFVVL